MRYLLTGITAGLAGIAIYYNSNPYIESLIVGAACAICYGIRYYCGATS